MVEPDVATELERVNEKLAMILVENHNVVIDKFDLLIKTIKTDKNQKAKIAESLRVIKVFEDRTESNDLVQDQFDVIEKVRKILKS